LSIEDLAYTDDVTLLSYTLRLAEELLHNLETAAHQVGLVVNEDKTEVLTLNQQENYQIKTINGKSVKSVNNFTYLGSSLPNSETAFKERKGQAWAAMNKLNKIWKSAISRNIKVRFFQACIESILLYGSETWTITARLKDRINGCYTKLLRKAVNVRWQDHPTNASVYQDLPKLADTIKKRRLNFAGHCARAVDQPASKLLFWNPPTGTTSRGRPLKTYSDAIKEDTGLHNENEILELMRNKPTWKDFVMNCTVSAINPPTGVT